MTYVRLSVGDKWRRQETTDGSTSTRAIKLKFLPIKKMMVHVTGAYGILRKSTNSGVTWTNATMLAGTDACLDVCEDPDGNIWGLFWVTGSSTAKVAVSTNAMVSWTLKYTHDAGKQAFNIACSPQRSANYRIAFTARDDTGVGADLGDHFELVVSTDSGVTWATKDVDYRLTDDNDEPLIQYVGTKVQVLFRGRALNHTSVGWDAITTQDIRFVTHWGNGWADPGLGDGVINPLTDRAVVVLNSASGDPVLSVSGATSTLLWATDSGTPANFGGDGHGWWRVYLLVPTADFIDFTGTTGAFRNCSFFRAADDDLIGITYSFSSDLQYHGSGMGTKVEIAAASQGTTLGDVLWNWIWDEERTIDDLFFDKEFNDGASFDHDYSRHNSAFIPFTPGGGEASSIDWYIDEGVGGNSHSVTARYTATAVADPDIFPNSVRILAIEASLKLTALRDDTMAVDPSTWVISSTDDGDTWDEDYVNEDAPLPIEMLRYGDTSPSFGAIADPNTILRSTGGEWSEFDDPMTVGGLSFEIASLAYDLKADRLFVSYVGDARIFSLQNASIADAAQANAAAAAVSDTILDEGVVNYWRVVPATDEPPISYRQLIVHKKAFG